LITSLKYIVIITSFFVLPACSDTNTKNTRKNSKSDTITTFKNPLYDGADPWMMKHNGKYYTCYVRGDSILVSESDLMTKIEKEKAVFIGSAQKEKLYNFWAPELHYIDGKWYIYFAASTKDGTPFTGQRTRVLEAANPFGPYTDKGVVYTGDDYENQTSENNVWAIDMNVFEYKSKWYAVWSGWESQDITDNTPQHTYIAELVKPWKIGKRVLLSKATEDWEKGDAFSLQEGQEVLKHNGDLFIIYSTRGSWTKHYKLGLLKLVGDDPLNPADWKKYGPVFQGTETVHGVGHASFVKSPDNSEYWIYYHSKKDTIHGWDRDVRLQKFKFDENGFPVFGKPVDTGIRIKRPSGEVND
jgi:GH43 family beta-xylosidase